MHSHLPAVAAVGVSSVTIAGAPPTSRDLRQDRPSCLWHTYTHVHIAQTYRPAGVRYCVLGSNLSAWLIVMHVGAAKGEGKRLKAQRAKTWPLRTVR